MLLCATSARAHNPDTSYARFELAPDGLTTRLTYDVVTLVKIVPNLDADGDRRLTPVELAAAQPAIVDFLRRHIAVEIDGKAADFGEPRPIAWPSDLGDALDEKDYHAAKALMPFVFHTSLAAPSEDVWVQFEFFERIGGVHSVLGVFAFAGREEEVIFREFEPDYLYDTGYRRPSPSASTSPSVAPPSNDAGNDSSQATHHTGRGSSASSVWSNVRLFFHLGIEHILIGYDHILFLLALIIVSRLGDLVKIVTSFTVAHTITLMLATLEVIRVDREWVEIAIAATIVYTAVENFWIRLGNPAGRRRWMLTFAFGLVHGFGFAGVLSELGLPTEGLVRSLVAFNVGVEAGQLAIVAALYLPVAYLRSRPQGRMFQIVASALVGLCGLGWLVDRVLGWSVMPI